jgi:N-acyl-D-aspartate/D-glutamate deacylase
MCASFDVLIKKASIVNGKGGKPFHGSVGVIGEKIAAVGDVDGDADREINGSGLVVCPGFIDTHSHADSNILRYPKADSLVMQGITTVLGGNCGMSTAPINNLYSSMFAFVNEWWYDAEPEKPSPPPFLPLDKYGVIIKEKLGLSIDWQNFDEFLSRVEKTGTSVNYAPLVGHGTIRTAVMGDDFKRTATRSEVEEMGEYVDRAMQSGAFGISTGVDYLPGEYADKSEIIELLKIAKRYHGIHAPHLRHVHIHWSSDDQDECGTGIYHGPLEDAWVGRHKGLLEGIEVSREAKIPLHIVHLDNVFRIPQPHPDSLEEAASKATLDIVDEAIKGGLDVTFNVIVCPPTDISGVKPLINEFWKSRNTNLKWINLLGKEEFLEKIRTEEFREKIKEVSASGRLTIGITHTKADPYWMNRFRILRCKNKEYEGKTLVEIALRRNTEPLDTLFDMLIEDPETLWLQIEDERAREATKKVFLRHPAAMPCTDMVIHPFESGSPPTKDLFDWYAPPMAYGMYADYLGNWVREKKVLSLEEAVRKATYLPAQTLGLKDRGVVSLGAYADIVVFDYDKIRMTGDYLQPAQAPDGIEHVLVNGKMVFEQKRHTEERPGKVLRHNASIPS